MSTFEKVWEAYTTLPARDLITAMIEVNGKQMGLNHALRHCFNDTEALPDALRRQVVKELNAHRPASVNLDGNDSRREAAPQYWNNRIWRYSQAARALCPLLERKMVTPGRYPSPHG